MKLIVIIVILAISFLGFSEWHAAQAVHLYQARVQELRHCQSQLYQQLTDSGWVRINRDKEPGLQHASTVDSVKHTIRQLQMQIKSLPIFCTDQLMAKQTGNSCNRWRLAMLFHRCGPPGYNLRWGRFFPHTIYPLGSEIVPIQSISMSWINTPVMNDSIVFCLPMATGGTMGIVAK